MRLLQNPKNGYSGAMLAQMGILCVDNGPQSTPQMDRCAAIILQKAADAGYSGDPEVPNSEANFWLNFSRAHFKLWLRDGIRAERIHLKRSSWGWEKALTHVRIACDVGCWREAATVHMCLGDYPRAAQILGILIRSFPGFPGLPAVQLDVAMLLFQLQQYDQSYAYARAAMSTNRLPPPFTHMDLLFFIARICDKLSVQADEDRETARIVRRARRAELKEQRELEKERERLERIANGEEEEEEEKGDEDEERWSDAEEEDSTETEGEDLGGERRDEAEKARMGVLKNFKDCNLVEETVELEDWLNDPNTYKTLAKRAVDGGKYLLAVDLYRDALKLAKKIDTPDDVSDSDSDESTTSETSKELRKRKKREAKEAQREKKRQLTMRSQLVNQKFGQDEKEEEEEEEEEELSPEELAERERNKYKRVVNLWFGLAKAHCRCGQMEDAIRACKEGLSCPTDEGDKFENVLSHWSELSEGAEEDRERITAFEQEVNTDLPSILDKYVAGEKTMLSIDWDAIDDYNKPKTGDAEIGKKESQIVANYRKKLSRDRKYDRSEDLKDLHTIEDIENYMVNRRRWQIMREGVKGVAREVMKNDIFDALMKMAGKMERDCGDETIKNIALVGFSCASETSGSNDTVNMFVGGCLLLAKAFDYGWLDIVKREHSLDVDGGEEAFKNAEARLWKTRALSHWRVYEKQGCGAGKGEKVHLEHSLAAWDKALKHLSVASDLKCWMCYARAALAKGDYGVAANAYGTILKSFRMQDKVGIALVCSSLLKALGVYDQSIAYMFSAISMAGMGGGPGNYDSIDLAFLMARLHEEHGWFEQQKQEGEARAARKSMRKSRKSGEDLDALRRAAAAEAEAGGASGGEARSMAIAKTAYLAVFYQLQELQEEEEKDAAVVVVIEGDEEGGEESKKKKNQKPKHANAGEWLADHKTWLTIGDTCASAGHHIFAADLYEQALKRKRRGKEKQGASERATIAVKVAKSFRKCGQFDRSIDALTMAINEEPDSLKKTKLIKLCNSWKAQADAGKGGRRGRNTAGADGMMPFKVAMMLPVSDILKKYVPRPAIRQEDQELKRLKAIREMKARNGKWKHLRRKLKEAARKQFAKDYVGELWSLDKNSDGMRRSIMKGDVSGDLMEELVVANSKGGYASSTVNLKKLDELELRARDEVTVALKMLVTMGKLCHDSSAASNGMHRCAATLLQRAADCGYVGDGIFWKQVRNAKGGWWGVNGVIRSQLNPNLSLSCFASLVAACNFPLQGLHSRWRRGREDSPRARELVLGQGFRAPRERQQGRVLARGQHGPHPHGRLYPGRPDPRRPRAVVPELQGAERREPDERGDPAEDGQLRAGQGLHVRRHEQGGAHAVHAHRPYLLHGEALRRVERGAGGGDGRGQEPAEEDR
jgi:tetratricopeptide (TPR) repeat protein